MLIARAGGNESDTVLVEGVTPNFLDITGAEFERGRPFTPLEDRAGARVAVVGANLATALFGAENPLGRTLTLGGDTYTVVGVLEKRRGGFLGENRQDNVLSLPVTTVRRRFGEPDRVVLYIQAQPGVRDACQRQTEAALRQLRRLPADADNDFTLSTADGIIATFDGISARIGAATVGLGAISLIKLTAFGAALVSVLFVFIVVFWTAFEQAGGSMTIFAADYTDRTLVGTAGMAFKIVNTAMTLVPAAILTWLLFKLYRSTGGQYALANVSLAVAFVAVYVGFHLLGTFHAGTWSGPLSLGQGLFILMLAPAFFEILFHPQLQVVDVKQECVVDVLDRRIDVARNGDVDQENRPVLPTMDGLPHILDANEIMGRAGRAKHDVGLSHLTPEMLERNGRGIEPLRQLHSICGIPGRNQHTAHALVHPSAAGPRRRCR